MKHTIATAKNGPQVYVNLIGSYAGDSIGQHPYLLGILKEIVEKSKLSGPKMSFEQDMGRPVGSADVVETTEKDVILYAQTPHGEDFLRYVKNGKPESTNHVSLTLIRDEDGNYELTQTWVGRMRPPYPGTDSETKAGREYWDKHAFVLDRQPIKLRTLTKTRPY